MRRSRELRSKSTENLKYKDVKSRNIRELSVSDSRSIFGFFGKIIYVKPAQNHNFELVTIIGYVHNLFTQPIFDVIVWT